MREIAESLRKCYSLEDFGFRISNYGLITLELPKIIRNPKSQYLCPDAKTLRSIPYPGLQAEFFRDLHAIEDAGTGRL